MSNVVSFPRQDEDRIVWRCNCGCLTHYLRADGELQCASCNQMSSDAEGEWRKRLPETPARPADVEEGDTVSSDLNSSAAAMRRVLGKATDHTEVAAVFVIFKDGRISAWGGVEGDAQHSWLERRAAEACNVIKSKAAK